MTLVLGSNNEAGVVGVLALGCLCCWEYIIKLEPGEIGEVGVMGENCDRRCRGNWSGVGESGTSREPLGVFLLFLITEGADAFPGLLDVVIAVGDAFCEVVSQSPIERQSGHKYDFCFLQS